MWAWSWRGGEEGGRRRRERRGRRRREEEEENEINLWSWTLMTQLAYVPLLGEDCQTDGNSKGQTETQ